MLGSGVVSCQARKQKTVASSFCEAEYTAAFEASKERIWLRTLLNSINHVTTRPTTICCDNNTAINLSEDPALHNHLKHINIKHHFLREHIQSTKYPSPISTPTTTSPIYSLKPWTQRNSIASTNFWDLDSSPKFLPRRSVGMS